MKMSLAWPVRALFLALVASLSLSALSAVPAQADHSPGLPDLKNCPDFINSEGDGRWMDAQRYLMRAYQQSGSYDQHHLDGDRDFYACEANAKTTKAAGEPDCDDCAGLKQYRYTYWMTWGATDDVPLANQVPAVKKALLDTFAAFASKDDAIEADLADAYRYINSTHLKCVRPLLRSFVKLQHDFGNVPDAAVKMLGYGQKAIEKVANGTYPTLVTTWMDLGGDVADLAADVAVAEQAKKKLFNVQNCTTQS